ncbi:MULTISPECIES: VanZ family protein [Actinomadura]|uniref:VanZ family protein n=1 Tax=Actinomadura yumaensis TaxID=111807 RepID=A0ABW2CAY7_9ACTN|nr:VanZ family protein [Actinomadura sp. J1-007]
MPDHVPFEAVRALALWAVLAAGAALLVWRPLVRRTGWAAPPTLALLAWTGLVLAMTLPMTVAPGSGGRLGRCVAHPVADIAWSVRIFGTRGLEDVMNVALWVPCGFLAVLATRRPIAAPAVTAAVFVAVEFLQTLDPGRECDPGDWAYNSAGVAAGALVGAVLIRRRRFRPVAADRSVR